MERRRFLQLGAAVGIGATVAGSPFAAAVTGRRPLARSAATGRLYEPVAAFPSGVLSGDPTSDGIVLWTRIDPAVAGPGVEVIWEVADDVAFGPGSLLASGSVTTDAASDHTVHVEVDGLGAGAIRWYRFTVDGTSSPIGRTKTLPDGPVDDLAIAFFSCQRYVHGHYNAHADLAARALDPATDVDLVVCVGDYVYEAGPADGVTVPGRVDPAAPTVTLADFRRQYHRYRDDLDLQAMHAAFPFAGVFDNHDGMRDPADPAGPGAVAAFFEQMPIRRFADDPDRQHRSLRLGDLGELFLLDERQYRDPEPASGPNPLGTTTVEQPAMTDPARTMLGSAQRQWLEDGLAASTSAWKLIGSQLMLAPLRSERLVDDQVDDGRDRNAGRYVNLTQWDGYQAERRRLVDHLRGRGIADTVVVSGDTHFWTASEVSTDWDDPTAPYVLTEFGGSSVTSANADEMDLPGNDLIRPVVGRANPLSLRYMEVTAHGYALVELHASRATVTYLAPATVVEPGAPSSVLARFEVDRGTQRIRQVEGDRSLAEPPPAGPGPGEVDGPSGSPGRPAAAPGAEAVSGRPVFTG